MTTSSAIWISKTCVIICYKGEGEELLRKGRKGFHLALDGNYTRQV